MVDDDGRRVLVIGGSRSIRAAIVSRSASDGYDVSFTFAGSEAAEVLAGETGARAIRSDAADRQALVQVARDSGPLDVFVFNAGVFVSVDPLTLDPDVVDCMIDIDLRASYHAAVEAGRVIPDGGRIVVIGSGSGDRVAAPGFAAYAMTKSALHGVAGGLARGFGHREITVNVVLPGPSDTDMSPAAKPSAGTMHGFMALKRHSTAADVASLIAYVAGPTAESIAGSMQTIDGGWVA